MRISGRVDDKTNIAVVTTRLINILLEMPMAERLALLESLEEKRKHKDKRKYPRGIYSASVEIHRDDASAKGMIQNLSPEGLLVATKTDFEVGDNVSLTFKLPNSEDLIQIAASIVRKSPGGIGVQFKMPILDFLK